jgi:hypothetical protein
MPKHLYVDFDGVLHPSYGGDLFCKMQLLEEALMQTEQWHGQQRVSRTGNLAGDLNH